jgi:secretion/DNA translocation related TadE-like protein
MSAQSREHPRRCGRCGRVGRRERGSATVQAVVLVAVLTCVALGVMVIAQALIARRATAAAADLAALAGASAVQRGHDACAAAGQVARANHALLSECSVQGEEVLVTASRPLHSLTGWETTVTGTARAGPQRLQP